MPSNPISLENSLIPEDPAYPEAAPSQGDGFLEKIASELYRISSMLLGEGEDGIGLVETVVATVDLPACHNPVEARHNSRMTLAAEAIELLNERDSTSLIAPVENSGPVSCIEDDDLDSVGVTPADLEQMITGPESHRLRDWLEGLPVSLRLIFVLRAVAGLSSAEVAALLAENTGSHARDWTSAGVRTSFRQALCSLASQLIQATTEK
jgi:hypothetical protein